MPKKLVISESVFKKIMAENIISEEISKSDIVSIIKDSLKNDRSVKSDIEKKVKELVAASVNTLFRTLWQRRNFYEDEIKKG